MRYCRATTQPRDNHINRCRREDTEDRHHGTRRNNDSNQRRNVHYEQNQGDYGQELRQNNTSKKREDTNASGKSTYRDILLQNSRNNSRTSLVQRNSFSNLSRRNSEINHRDNKDKEIKNLKDKLSRYEQET